MSSHLTAAAVHTAEAVRYFAAGPAPATPLRAAITAACRIPEPEAVAPLLEQARLPSAMARAVQDMALQLSEQLRARKPGGGKSGLVQGLLQEFSLSSQEGIALMCLAEALLRIPDNATRDALIRDKIRDGNWHSHLGKSPSLFVNAAAWGLLLTGKLVATHSEGSLGSALARLTAKGGEPLVRKGVHIAMRMMGEQFVTGETIGQALANARRLEAQGFRYSYDMLGEAALTAQDAERYLQSYVEAIHAIGLAANGRGIYEGPGISIKLSALHPRYSRAQYGRVMSELLPRVLQLAELACKYDIGLNIDAEEADRLELSLDLLEALSQAPSLAGWNGLGFVIQAYQKRCPAVIDYVIDLARRSRRRLMVRLVKGAYWDSEIKRAQIDGLADYPVYTRKVHTDVSYLACARRLLAAPDAVYPQFATHNAQTLASIYQMAGPEGYARGQYEFQCLHGMGESLYEQVVGPMQRPCRIYAPVGTHETLLAYLVRRLLENGANTSFVHRIADPSLSLAELAASPITAVDQAAATEGLLGAHHPHIPLPSQLYGAQRSNSQGLDLASEAVLQPLQAALTQALTTRWHAAPLLAVPPQAAASHPTQAVRNPADHGDVLGTVRAATLPEVELALLAAQASAADWTQTPPAERARLLRAAADAYEAQLPQFIALLLREAGKTAANAVAEVREAVDFLRYYATQVQRDFANATHIPLGPVVCISPWNFPLAIFTGQIAAALAAGNVVLAKPAEQTPLIAHLAVQLLQGSGIPAGALQLLPGEGETVGAALVADARVQGVLFTGSTEVARLLQRSLAQRLRPDGQPVVLVAETGGQNAMVVDSSALVEQVVGDVLSSAFDSAGQRCSALRLLCVQEDAAERVLDMLRGAMQELACGNPSALTTDVGPVIDVQAQAGIQGHIAAMQAKGRHTTQAALSAAVAAAGCYVPPTLIEIASIDELQREVFGPVLHVLRWRRHQLPQLLDQIAATGYGLTQGLHTRIDETVDLVLARAQAGNLYVNRNMVGAVVGVQPFGGEGLSGTGPKAGGPLYVLRLLARHPGQLRAVLERACGPAANSAPQHSAALQALAHWATAQAGQPGLHTLCQQLPAQSPVGLRYTLPGPTGERNTYTLLPRSQVLCQVDGGPDSHNALLHQLAAVLAVGGQALWAARHAPLYRQLPVAVQPCITLLADSSAPHTEPVTTAVDVALHCGSAASLQALQQQLAARSGPLVACQHMDSAQATIPLERLLLERAVSINTAAAGGNASLMTMA
ncbi:trifunctional transcriptional regulator/proline dehydrogenase/L-glutamate gamma-semialdehyde dehydrogenase [Comamonas sp. GB3 AK4-5]|uniref:trifunctional transcriptional regulator/proline dehydrogenase/L-glutamate gamma-semialdehyde dehydrogenase n=1 Tax=Comamonas sp. GB3 AK4-5 TaxID=3231487 RepID=UPI00351F462D